MFNDYPKSRSMGKREKREKREKWKALCSAAIQSLGVGEIIESGKLKIENYKTGKAKGWSKMHYAQWLSKVSEWGK